MTKPQGEYLIFALTTGHYCVYTPLWYFDLRHRWATNPDIQNYDCNDLILINHATITINRIMESKTIIL